MAKRDGLWFLALLLPALLVARHRTPMIDTPPTDYGLPSGLPMTKTQMQHLLASLRSQRHVLDMLETRYAGGAPDAAAAPIDVQLCRALQTSVLELEQITKLESAARGAT